MSILEVNDLSISFNQYTGGLRQRELKVITDLEVSLNKGEILAIVGASGSGKSLLAHSILGILPDNANVSGSIKYKGETLTAKRQQALRATEIALIPQSVNYLNPLMRVGKQVRSPVNDKATIAAQRQAFERLRLSPEVEGMYPFQLSGGMARRILLSTAIVRDAELIIADEPTPGLDPVVIKEALQSFRELADDGRTILLITHDIEAALQIADRIAVLYAGTILEVAAVDDFSGKGERLRHPYTEALWRALPQNDFVAIPGSQPKAADLPPGCLFAPRCPLVMPECNQAQPAMRELRAGRVRCIHAA
ncbi:ABC transporter ATP-binding protein [Psychrobacter phenylpyruvicus]|uniref:Nickel import system ATP-binding protein NikD n=1 Tax=Psychrobacter phenylpyruvicus TaxID=29432 RepID=A0A379LLB5_9GAMM|nr:ABC transporter ATP-binding protein [Psychrobacter phenylpyruvicus]SUD90564.1 Glutathione import ATP-binding protein GsiA [Psychrobacter phenylpyruvicus]